MAHPPGFPLWVLLAHLATLLPWGSVASRVHASSALFAAAAAGLAVVALRLAVAGRTAGTATESGDVRWRPHDLVPPALAGLLLASSRTLWTYATVAEVYALNTLLVVALLTLLLAWRRRPEDDRPLLLAAALFGLALGVHHVTVALLLPAFAVLVWRTAGPTFFRSRRLARAAGVALLAATAIYLYLPWAASQRTGLNWGNPDQPTRFFEHLTGRQYRVFLAPSLASVKSEIGAWTKIVLGEFGPTWIPLAVLLALLGARELWRSDRTLFATLVTLVAVNSSYGLFYTIAEDKDAYYLPTLIAIALLAAFGLRALLAASGRRAAWIAGGALLLPVAALLSGWQANDRSDERVAERFVDDSLAGMADGGLLLTSEWQLYSPWLYLHEVEGRRPDLMAIDTFLLRRSWYYDFLNRRAPALLAAASSTVDPFLADLTAWDRDPGLYERDRNLNRRINERFHAMILDLVARQREHGAVYASRDVVLPPFAPDPELSQLLAARYSLVPHGLVFELTDDAGSTETGRIEPPPALFDRARPLDPGSVAAQKVRPAYLTMMTSRGFWLAGQARTAEARAAFAEVLQLEPSFDPARQALARLPPP